MDMSDIYGVAEACQACRQLYAQKQDSMNGAFVDAVVDAKGCTACCRALRMPEIVQIILLSMTKSTKEDYFDSLLEFSRVEVDAGPLGACRLVNNLFHDRVLDIVSRRVILQGPEMLEAYLESPASRNDMCESLCIYKCNLVPEDYATLSQTRLRRLEICDCKHFVLTEKFLVSQRLTDISLPICPRVDDGALCTIAHNCPQLRILNVRACSNISDTGIAAIVRCCPELDCLNVSQFHRHPGITDASTILICKLTKARLLGLATCSITDKSIDTIRELCGHRLLALSVDGCGDLTAPPMRRLLEVATALCYLDIAHCPGLEFFEVLSRDEITCIPTRAWVARMTTSRPL